MQFFDNYANIQTYTYHKGYIYGLGGELVGSSWEAANKAEQFLFCADAADGTVKWKTEKRFRMGDFLCLADGMLFVRSYQRLDLVEASSSSFNLLSSIEKVHDYSDLKSARALTDFVEPVVAKGRLFLRTPEELVCYKIK
jgi:outer membrane protein assembly factor BamB